MARVPSKFNPEPGKLYCGYSFDERIVVSGEIYGRGGFGSEKTQTIGKLAEIPAGTWWSHRSQDEADFIENVNIGINATATSLDEAVRENAINSAQENAIAWLLKLSDANMERAEAIYDYWDGKGPHPDTGFGLPVGLEGMTSEWPLPTGDAIFQHISQCQGVSGEWIGQRGLVGQNVEHIRWYFCPTEETKRGRTRDRDAIRQLLLDAARAVRCAQWGLWRLILYRESLAEWEEEHGGFGFRLPPGTPPVDPTPGITPGGLGFTAEGPDPEPPGGHPDPPPWEPSDFRVPEPGDLPPPEDADQEPESDPDLPTTPELDRMPGGPPVAAAGPLGKIPVPLAVGAGALVLWLITK